MCGKSCYQLLNIRKRSKIHSNLFFFGRDYKFSNLDYSFNQVKFIIVNQVFRIVPQALTNMHFPPCHDIEKKNGRSDISFYSVKKKKTLVADRKY